jgi:hypothetical protein
MGMLLTACDDSQPTGSEPQPQPSPSNLPDLVVTDIILKPKPAGYGQQDDVIINTVVRNNGADCKQGFLVWCSYSCDGNPTYFSGMQATNGLGSNQEITLGDDALLSLSSCSFRSQRQFSCTVDADNIVTESNESNNTLTEVLLTGR